MKIETFVGLLKAKNGSGASAYVPEREGSRQLAVAVSYREGGKCYDYSGSIFSVAQRLELIPEIDVPAEAAKAVRELHATGKAEAHSKCSDTINYLLDLPGKVADYTVTGMDEFGYQVAAFYVAENDWI